MILTLWSVFKTVAMVVGFAAVGIAIVIFIVAGIYPFEERKDIE